MDYFFLTMAQTLLFRHCKSLILNGTQTALSERMVGRMIRLADKTKK